MTLLTANNQKTTVFRSIHNYLIRKYCDSLNPLKNKLKGLLLNWLINKSPEDDTREKCFVSYDVSTGYLHAFMPNGERIPHQTNMTLKDNLNEQMEVTITFLCEYKP